MGSLEAPDVSPTSPPRHQQAQPVTGGPLRAACLGSCPPSLQLAWSLHAMLILAKNPFSQPSAKPKSQGWSQEAAEVFGYHRTEAESLARRWPGHTRGSCSLWGEHRGQSHVQGLCMSRCNSRLSVCGCSLSSLPRQRVGRWGRTPGKAQTEKPSPDKGSEEDSVLLEPCEAAASSWS